MSKLTALDSAFLLLETREIPAHVAMLQIFELPKGKGSAWLGSMMDELRQHPPGAPFNLRVKTHLAGLPEMVVDQDFDIDYHLRHTVLPKPGNDEQLRNVVARLHGNLLDRDRPLWEFHLIEGLEGRRFAFYIKIHHAICDGATFAKWMSESTDLRRSHQPMKPIWERAIRQPSPTERPWLDTLQAPGNMLRTYTNLGLGLGQLGAKLLRERFVKHDKNIALPLSAPSTALNAPLTPARNLAFTSFPLADLKAIGRPFEATINDVVLALCDAALRRYLGEQGQAPDKPLVAMVPVNLRVSGSTAEGNQVTALQVKLGGENEDPASRLRTVRESMRAARAVYSDIPSAASQAYSLLVTGLGALGMSLKLEGIMPPPLNLIISNVPGPRETRYFNGAELQASWPVSGIAPMTVINVTVYSYAGDLYFGLISARRAIPHLQDLKLCIDEVFAEFQQAIVV